MATRVEESALPGADPRADAGCFPNGCPVAQGARRLKSGASCLVRLPQDPFIPDRVALPDLG